jgi:hypothetical protein
MFGELPKLFGRNFATAFFLPCAIFVAMNIAVLEQINQAANVYGFLQKDILIGTTLCGLSAWVGGVALMILNRDLYRILEGYGRFNPLRLFGWMEKKRYLDALRTKEEIDDQSMEHKKVEKGAAASRIKKIISIMKELADQFPDAEQWLLPTAFGNTLRAFEVYPRVMYGIEATVSWTRLLAVIPKEYRELIDDAKSQVDFWVNMSVLTVLFIFEYASLVIAKQLTPHYWIFLLALIPSFIAPWRAQRAAIEWGELVKSSFDIYLPIMQDHLEFKKPKNREQEKLQWKSFSQAIIYRLPNSMPERKRRTNDQTQK